jgi:unsaturated rhamnogalacturonyl hydrolase
MISAAASDAERYRALVRAVVVRTMRWPFRMWAFGEAVALRGLLSAGRATGDGRPLGFVHALLRAYVGRGVGRSPEEHVAPASELLTAYSLDGDDTWLDAARRLAGFNASAPMGPNGVRYRRPDLAGWRRQIWVDSMDGIPPFLARLARVTQDESHAQEAIRELAGYGRLLQDERGGLFMHGFEESCGRNGQHWARGNGWAAMGLAETLASLPGPGPHADELQQRLVALLDALAAWQHPCGLWSTVVDRPETPLETTLAAMIVCAIDGAWRAGLLPGEQHRAMRDRAHAAVLGHVSEEGELALVSDATPIGELRMYATRPFGIFPWGQGPLLLMLAGPGSEPRNQPVA